MTEQSEAQRLAAALDALLGYRGINADVGKAAAELRRLEAVNAQLLEALEFPATLDVAGADDRAKALILDVVIWKARAAIAAAKGET
jgi:hypothetical protein